MRRLCEYGSYAIGFASLFLLWHVAAVYLVQSALFPPPGSVIARAVALFRDGTLVANVAISLQRILTGFVCGSLLGIPIGLAMGSFAPIRRILDPYTEFLRFIPGVASIARNKIRAAQALGATRFQIFCHVALPATVPYILTGMRLAMTNSFVTI